MEQKSECCGRPVEWKVIRVGEITVAQGNYCTLCNRACHTPQQKAGGMGGGWPDVEVVQPFDFSNVQISGGNGGSQQKAEGWELKFDTEFWDDYKLLQEMKGNVKQFIRNLLSQQSLQHQEEMCGVCGSEMVYIRGRYPGHDNRLICPCCAQERLEQIRDIANPEYGKSYKNLSSS